MGTFYSYSSNTIVGILQNPVDGILLVKDYLLPTNRTCSASYTECKTEITETVACPFQQGPTTGVRLLQLHLDFGAVKFIGRLLR